MKKQTSHKLIMIKPTHFGFNEEAFLTNSFQQRPTQEDQGEIQSLALSEFNCFVDALKGLNVDVDVYTDLSNSTSPDSIFPNNWFSTHQSGELILYPMAVKNRRKERREDIVTDLIEQYNYSLVDLTHHEQDVEPIYLEGTGSMLIDHIGETIYGAISPRTSEKLLNVVGQKLGYSVVEFTSYGKSGEQIYHTNVMLCIGKTFACIGADTIHETDRNTVLESLKNNGKQILELSNDQVYNHFGGNILQIENASGESILVLSNSAFESLKEEQLTFLKNHNDHILPISIPTIERIGGGSVRCMLAEVFIPDFNNLNS
jgi:hypothetical protein